MDIEQSASINEKSDEEILKENERVKNMAPKSENSSTDTGIGSEREDVETIDESVMEKLVAPQASPRTHQIIYKYVVTFSYLHAAAIYGVYLCFTSAKWSTIFFNWILFTLADIGITAGAHRLWSHRSYKAKTPLQIILMIMNSLAFQNTAFSWARDHRMHHKYCDTDGDPHNSTRGFFFSHIGWLMVKKHPEIQRRGKFVDLSDIYANPVLMFQKRYAIPLIGTICFLLPTVVPMYFWGETLNNAWHVNILRYVLNLQVIYMVNSLAHLVGYKPYDKNIKPTENLLVSMATYGEGFHNYHHVFPWDYRSAEFGNDWFNLTTKFIDFFAWIGWAYDLKTVSKDMIKARAARTGDLSEHHN